MDIFSYNVAKAFNSFCKELERHAFVCLTIHDTTTNVDMYTYNKVERIDGRETLKFTSLSGVERIVPISKLDKYMNDTINISNMYSDDDYFEYGG